MFYYNVLNQIKNTALSADTEKKFLRHKTPLPYFDNEV
jgi:hypothetical protein